MIIKLNTVADVNDFVSICNTYHNINIDVKQGRHVIDGKSILGIYSLNLLKTIGVSIDSDDNKYVADFYTRIKKWEVGK